MPSLNTADLERLAALSPEMRAALLPNEADVDPQDRPEELDCHLWGFAEAVAALTEAEAAAAGVPFVDLAHAALKGVFVAGLPVTEAWEPEHTALFLSECADVIAEAREGLEEDERPRGQDLDDRVSALLYRGQTPVQIAKELGVPLGEVTRRSARFKYEIGDAYEAGQRAEKAEAAAKARRKRGRTLSKLERKVTAALEEADFSEVPADKLAALLIKITDAQRTDAAEDAVVVPL